MKCTWALVLLMCVAWVNSMKIDMVEDSAPKKDSVPITPAPRGRVPRPTPITRIPHTAPDQDTELNQQDQYVLASAPLHHKGLRGTPATHFPHNAVKQANKDDIQKNSEPITPALRGRYRVPPSTPITRIPRTASDQDSELNQQDGQDQYVLSSPPLRHKGLKGTPATHFPHNAVKQANKDDIQEPQRNQYILKNSTSATVTGWREQQLERTGLNCVCGMSMRASNSRIVNGWEVLPKNNYKWQVGLSGANTQYFCGGSIINDYYILTASHCVTDSNYNCFKPSEVYVGVGDHNMYSESDNTKYTAKLKVQKIICHPHYNPENYDNDIALLKLKMRLDIVHSPSVGSICLPSDSKNKYAYSVGTASGWGKLHTQGQQPGPLQEMDLPILPSSCWGYKQYVTENQLCTFAVWGDTCQGDSGGPLSVRMFDGQYTQVGITSFSFGKCDNGETPTIFTKVTMYLNWIMDNTYDAGYCRTI